MTARPQRGLGADPTAIRRAIDRARGMGTILSPSQIYQTALNAGFPSDVATQMTAIALRESAGNPAATNLTPAEQSYGLWQINIQGNPTLMSQLGITDPSQLLDPTTNARAAFLLYGGNPSNLNTAWYINQPGYAQAYAQYLPVAEQAASDVLGVNPPAASDASVFAGVGAGIPPWGWIAAGVLGILVLREIFD